MSYSSICSLKVYLLRLVDCDDSVTCLAMGWATCFDFKQRQVFPFSPTNPGLLWDRLGSLSNGYKSFLWRRVKLHVMPRLNIHELLYPLCSYIFIAWYPLTTVFRYAAATKRSTREGSEDGVHIFSFPLIGASRSNSLRLTTPRPKHLSVTSVITWLSLRIYERNGKASGAECWEVPWKRWD